MELESHDSSPEPSSPVEDHRVLCDRCSDIVTNDISKYNAIQASVTVPLWQVSYYPPQFELDNHETGLDELYRQQEAYDREISSIRDALDLLATNRRRVTRCISMYKSLFAPICRLPVDILFTFSAMHSVFDASPSRSFSDVFIREGTMTPLSRWPKCAIYGARSSSRIPFYGHTRCIAFMI